MSGVRSGPALLYLPLLAAKRPVRATRPVGVPMGPVIASIHESARRCRLESRRWRPRQRCGRWDAGDCAIDCEQLTQSCGQLLTAAMQKLAPDSCGMPPQRCAAPCPPGARNPLSACFFRESHYWKSLVSNAKLRRRGIHHKVARSCYRWSGVHRTISFRLDGLYCRDGPG